MRICGDHDGGIAVPQRIPDVFAQLLEQKFVLRIKLDAVLMVTVLVPGTLLHSYFCAICSRGCCAVHFSSTRLSPHRHVVRRKAFEYFAASHDDILWVEAGYSVSSRKKTKLKAMRTRSLRMRPEIVTAEKRLRLSVGSWGSLLLARLQW